MSKFLIALMLLTLSSSASAEVIQIEPYSVYGFRGQRISIYEGRLFLRNFWPSLSEFKKQRTPFNNSRNSLVLTSTADTDALTINDIALTGDDRFSFLTTIDGLTIADWTIETTTLVSGGTSPFDPPVVEVSSVPAGDVQISGTFEWDMVLTRNVPESAPIGLDGRAEFSLGEIELTTRRTITARQDGIVLGEVTDEGQRQLDLRARYECGGSPPHADCSIAIPFFVNAGNENPRMRVSDIFTLPPDTPTVRHRLINHLGDRIEGDGPVGDPVIVMTAAFFSGRIPEPSTLLMALCGVVLFVSRRNTKK